MKWLDPSFLEDFIWAQSLWPSSFSYFIYGFNHRLRPKTIARQNIASTINTFIQTVETTPTRYTADRKTLDIMGAQLKPPPLLKPHVHHSTIVLGGALNWATMLSRDVSLSDNKHEILFFSARPLMMFLNGINDGHLSRQAFLYR